MALSLTLLRLIYVSSGSRRVKKKWLEVLTSEFTKPLEKFSLWCNSAAYSPRHTALNSFPLPPARYLTSFGTGLWLKAQKRHSISRPSRSVSVYMLLQKTLKYWEMETSCHLILCKWNLIPRVLVLNSWHILGVLHIPLLPSFSSFLHSVVQKQMLSWCK